MVTPWKKNAKPRDTRKPYNNDVFYLQHLNDILNDGKTIEVRVNDVVCNVAMNKYFTRWLQVQRFREGWHSSDHSDVGHSLHHPVTVIRPLRFLQIKDNSWHDRDS